jgi:hypothetical protein
VTRSQIEIDGSRRGESHYGVVISSTDHNKTATHIRILFYPQGKIEEVSRSRLDFALPPTDIRNASNKFLENFVKSCPNSPLALSAVS